MYISSPCLTGQHPKCEDKACTCRCHMVPRSKLTEYCITVYAPSTWTDETLEIWLRHTGDGIKQQLKRLATINSVNGVKITVKE